MCNFVQSVNVTINRFVSDICKAISAQINLTPGTSLRRTYPGSHMRKLDFGSIIHLRIRPQADVPFQF